MTSGPESEYDPVDPDAASPPAGAAAPVDMGRLFRSQGADGPMAEQAMPALPTAIDQTRQMDAAIDHTGPLPMVAAQQAPPAFSPPTGYSPTEASEYGSLQPGAQDPRPIDPGVAAYAAVAATPEPAPSQRTYLGPPPVAPLTATATSATAPAQPTTDARRPTRAKASGLTFAGAGVLVVGVTVLVAIAEVFVHQKVTTITGVIFIVVAALAATRVRRDDLSAAWIWPPLAWVAVLLTAAQLIPASVNSFLLKQGLLVLDVLGANAPFILGGTAVATAIAVIRKLTPANSPTARRS